MRGSYPVLLITASKTAALDKAQEIISLNLCSVEIEGISKRNGLLFIGYCNFFTFSTHITR
jgi:hypothetical protein